MEMKLLFEIKQQIQMQLCIFEIHRELGERVMLLSNRMELYQMKIALNWIGSFSKFFFLFILVW